MKKFKIGDRVKVIRTDCFFDRHLNEIGTIIERNGDLYSVKFNDGELDDGYNSDPELITKNLENLVVGDVIEKDGHKKQVLAVLNYNGQKSCYVMSRHNNYNESGSFETAFELEDYGYKLVSNEPEEDVEEMTVNEVCEELGRTVKIVRD